MNAILKIDPEFESMCPPLTDDEYRQLEENILSEGVILMPLIVWDETIIDGHNRHKIALAHPNIEFRTHKKHFISRYDALSWICKNQLGRRNLTPQQKKYLVGQRYEAEKMSYGGDRKSDDVKSSDQIGHLIENERTRQRIAEDSHTSQGYVQRANQYAKGINAAEEVLPGIKNEILSGSIKPTDPEVAAIAKIPPIERRRKVEELRVPKEKPQPKPLRKEARQEMREIRDIYAGMRPDEPPPPASEDSILETLHSAVRDMIRICDTLFSDFPLLLADNTYKSRVIEIMQEPKQFILGLEEKENEAE